MIQFASYYIEHLSFFKGASFDSVLFPYMRNRETRLRSVNPISIQQLSSFIVFE